MNIVDKVNSIGKFMEKILENIVMVALAVFSSTVIAEVFFRYIIGASLYWSNELATFLFIYMVFFGGSVALKRVELMDVKFIKNLFPPLIKKITSIIGQIIMMIFSVVGFIYSIELIQTSIKTGTVSPAMLIPMAFIYLPIFIGFCLMFFFSFILLLNLLSKSSEKA